MSDRFQPMSIDRMLSWILNEYASRQSIFGIHTDLFFHPGNNDVFSMERYGKRLQTPIGVAAGPHSQLAQNIIAAWLCGARYIELKTIQTLDELEVSKPCIDMEDEGYNCEWSQELKLRESFDEYLNAWIIIHVLLDKFGWGASDDPGMIFNMSAGYNLQGIQTANVQNFLNLMENAGEVLDRKLDRLNNIYPEIRNLNIPSKISDNLTVSTMHGCPPDEIEKIGKYFMEQRKYHTTIKFNPTMLGPDRLREILHKQLKFESIVVPDEAFEHDLKYDDALTLIKNLTQIANDNQVQFSLKLTNTLEVQNVKNIFPSNATMAYLSGRALHPISVNVSAKLQKDFDGSLDISFSAGVDAFNVTDVLACNIKPVTTCTDILKPGGYTRLTQYLSEIQKRFSEKGSPTIDGYICARAGESGSAVSAGLSNLTDYSKTVSNNPAYHDRTDRFNNIKTTRQLLEFDCIKAPCTENCATDQEIPKYIYHTAKGEFDQALEVILNTNPMPGVTGYVCDHLCEMKCTRQNLDSPLLIREIKRFALENGSHKPLLSLQNNLLGKVAIVGAGPSGLSCAYFLAIAGFQVDIFESGDKAGGMVSYALPTFRLTDQTILNDIELIENLGVAIHYQSPVDRDRLDELRNTFDFVYLSIGAQLNKKLCIPGENLKGVMEPLDFLAQVREGTQPHLGTQIAVIGGGNTALDAARTARRTIGHLGKVTIIYRRTMHEMPADYIEVLDAIEEGIDIIELTAPVKIQNLKDRLALTCEKMRLGEKDSSGRARPVRISGSEFVIEFDTIIPAIGQDIVLDLFPDQTSDSIPAQYTGDWANVFSGGDAIRGASSVVNAVGDGKKTAELIMKSADVSNPNLNDHHEKSVSPLDIQKKLSIRKFGQTIHDFSKRTISFDLISRTMSRDEAMIEADRCLYCDDVCNICVSVCPNLANLSYQSDPASYDIFRIRNVDGEMTIQTDGSFEITQSPQVLNIADFCNECGNCTTFCPTSGRPFRDKPIFHLTEDVFNLEANGYFMHENQISRKSAGIREDLEYVGDQIIYRSESVTLYMERDTLRILSAQFTNDNSDFSTEQIIQLHILYTSLVTEAVFKS
ncbi:MAG: putative selenate reductase subunit YgfK [Candidatus Marinimicrobia bacterium]|nr:putative selenate reductase subunit YgfK [Candidatus Neomarinimicrobiota bacterium]